MEKDVLFDFFKLMKPGMQDVMKKTPRYFISVLIAGIFLFLSAGSAWSEQALQSEEFFKIFPKGKHTTWFRGVAKIEDGYAICGGIKEHKGRSNWAHVTKIDKFGNTIWERELGKKARNANFYKVVATRDKKLVLVGIVNSVPTIKWEAGLFSAASAWIVKLTTDGKVEWDRSFHSDNKMPNDTDDKTFTPAVWAENVIMVQNDDMIVLGNNSHGVSDAPAIWKINAQGKLIWNNTFKREDSIWSDVLFSFNQSEFVASGTAFNSITKDKHIWLVMFNNLGDILWEKKYKGKLFTAVKYSNDRIIIAGMSDFESNPVPGNKSSPRIWLSEIERNGNVKSLKYIEEAGLCDITNIWITDEKEILVIGNTCESERERIWTGRFTLSFTISSINKFLPVRKIRVNDVIPDGREGFLAVGSGAEHGNGSQGAWVLRTKFNSDKYR